MSEPRKPADSAAPKSPLSESQMRDLPQRLPRLGTSLGASPAGPLPGEPAIGQVLAGRYELRRRLGAGGMGVVFAAFDRDLQQEIALKLLQPHLLADPQARARFLDEAKIVRELTHPHIVRVFHLEQGADGTFLTMELLQGHNLREEITRRAHAQKRFTVDEVRRMGRELCAALHFAHQQTIHRDVKPENIWLNADGSIKLLDFGIARLLRPSQFTSTGMALGTAYYMAPEQLKGSKDVDHRADQYAVGVVLYELLTGEVPAGVIKPPHQRRKNLPVAVSAAVMKALEGSASDRHANMLALAEALHGKHRARLPWAAAAAVLIVLGIAAGTYPPWRAWLVELAALDSNRHTPVPAENSLPEPIAPSRPTDPPHPDPKPKCSPAEEQAARVKYRSELKVVNEARLKAARVATEIDDEARRSQEEIQRRSDELDRVAGKPEREAQARQQLQQAQEAQQRAERIKQLWQQHPEHAAWEAAGDRSLGAAEALSDDRDHAAALAELVKAREHFQFPLAWRDHAQETLTRLQTVARHVQTLTQDDRLLFVWPVNQAAAAEKQLLSHDGREALTLAKAAVHWLPTGDKLSAARKSALAQMHHVTNTTGTTGPIELLKEDCDRAVNVIQEADAQAQAGQSDKALAAYADSERLHKSIAQKWTERCVALAECRVREGKYAAAVDECTKALRLNPKLARAFAIRAWAHTFGPDKSAIDQALLDGEEAVRLDPASRWSYWGRATANDAKQDYGQAIQDYGEVIRRDPKSAEAYQERGVAYVHQNDYDRAIADFGEAIQLNPQGAEAYQLRGVVYRFKKDYDRALQDFDEAIRLAPQGAKAYRQRGITCRFAQAYDRALQALDEAIRLSPRYAQAHYERGLVHNLTKVYDQAIQDFNEAIRLDAGYARAYQQRGVAYAAMNDHENAIRDCEEANRRSPITSDGNQARGLVYAEKTDLDWVSRDNVEALDIKTIFARAYYQRGVAYVDKKDYDRAVQDFDEAIQLNPSYAEAYKERGVIAYNNMKAYDEGIRYLDDAIRLKPAYAEAFKERADAYTWKKDIDRAIRDYDEAIRLNPTYAQAFCGRGAQYSLKKDYDRAIRDYDQAIRLDPTHAQAYECRGCTNLLIKAYDRAIVDLNEAIRLNPACARAYQQRGVAYSFKEEYDRAIRNYDEAIRLDPTYAAAYQQRAVSYRFNKDYDRSIPDLNEAIRLDPTYAEAYQQRGLSYSCKGDRDRAIPDLDEAIRLNPTDALAYRERGVNYGFKKDYERAIRDLDTAIGLNHTYADAYCERGVIYSKLNVYDRAIRDFDEAIRLEPGLPKAYFQRGVVHNNRGVATRNKLEFRRAIQDYQQAMRLNPLSTNEYTKELKRTYENLNNLD